MEEGRAGGGAEAEGGAERGRGGAVERRLGALRVGGDGRPSAEEMMAEELAAQVAGLRAQVARLTARNIVACTRADAATDARTHASCCARIAATASAESSAYTRM